MGVSVGLDWKSIVLLPWASHTGLVLKNWFFLRSFHNEFLLRRFRCSMHLFFLELRKHMVATARAGGLWWSKWSPTASSCGLWWANAVTSSWFNSRLEVWIWTDILFEIQLFTAIKAECICAPIVFTSTWWLVGSFQKCVATPPHSFPSINAPVWRTF